MSRENILVNRSEFVKICDFGSSKTIDTKGKNTPYIVSRYYRAPELILCISNYTTAIDMWGKWLNGMLAVGCILAELITKEPLFQGKTEGDQLFAIFRILGSPSKEDLDGYTKQVPYDSSLFKEFKNFRPVSIRDRFSYIKDIDDLVDLLLKMLQFQFCNRISAADALKHPFFADVADEWTILIL